MVVRVATLCFLPLASAYVCANGNGPQCMGANGQPLDENDAPVDCSKSTAVPAGQDCLCLATGIPSKTRRNVTYDINATHQYNGPVLDLPSATASGNLISRLVQLLLEEGIGYHYTYNLPPTWQSLAFVLAPSGCKNIFVLDAPCDDYDEYNPVTHMGLEGWSGAHAAIQNNLVPIERRAIQLSKHTFSGREGMFVMKSAMDEAYFGNNMMLESYKGWNATMFPAIGGIFETLGDAIDKLGKLKAGPIGGTGGEQNARAWANTKYVEKTGDTGEICYNSATGVLSGDSPADCTGNVWISPACRGDPLKCIPTWTSAGWSFSEMTQWAAFYNMPLAIIDTSWGEYTSAPKKVQSAFYWWFPDTTFAKQNPEMVTLPSHNPDEHANALYKSAIVDTELTKFAWHHLGKADKGRGENIIYMLERLAIYDSEISELMVQLGNGITKDDVACKFARDYETRWRDWIPRNINWCEVDEMTDADGKCVACEPGYVPTSDSKSCVQCAAGHYCPKASKPIPCEPGFFCPNASVVQTPCPEGTVNSMSASTARDACVECAPGTYMGKEGRSVCNPCPVGFHSPNPGAVTCTACGIGRYQNAEGADMCKVCPATFTTGLLGSSAAGDCTCEVGTYWDRQADSCRECQDKVLCKGGFGLPVTYEGFYARYVGNTNSDDLSEQVRLKKSETYVPQQGAFSRLKVWECTNSHRCPGDESTVVSTMGGAVLAGELDLPFPVRRPEVCPDGTHNVACAQCNADRYGSLCTEDCASGMGITTVVIILVLLPCFMAGMYYGTSSPYSATPTAAFQLVSTFGIIVFFLQSLAVIKSFDIPWPIQLDISFDLFLFDLGGTAAGCVFGQDFLAQYWLPILMPPMFLLAMALAYTISQVVPPVKGRDMRMNVNVCLNVVGLLAAALYITLCKVVISYFECTPNPGDTDSTLAKFKQVECGSEERTQATIPMAFGLCVYVIAFFVLTLYLNYIAPSQFTHAGFRVRCKFLVNRWRPDLWWWGQVFILRNLCVSLVAVLSPDPTDQFMLMTSIMLMFLTANGMLMAWKDIVLCHFDNAITLLVLICVGSGHSILHYDALKKRAMFSGNDADVQAAADSIGAYANLLIALTVLVVVWVVAVIVHCGRASIPSIIRKNAEAEDEYLKFTCGEIKECIMHDVFWAAMQRVLEQSTYHDRIALEAWIRSIQHNLPADARANSTNRTTGRLTARLYEVTTQDAAAGSKRLSLSGSAVLAAMAQIENSQKESKKNSARASDEKEESEATACTV